MRERERLEKALWRRESVHAAGVAAARGGLDQEPAAEIPPAVVVHMTCIETAAENPPWWRMALAATVPACRGGATWRWLLTTMAR